MHHIRFITIDSLRGLLIMLIVLVAAWLFGVLVKKRPALPDYFKWVLLGLVLIFAFWGYINQPVYYFPNNNGVLGDNYYHMTRALEQDNYLKHHHLLFPLVAEKFVKGITTLGFVSESNPHYLETVFKWSSFPIRALACLSLFFFSWIIFNIRKSAIDAFLVFCLIAMSYGFWIFGIQSNALGMALSLQLIVAGFYMLWWKKLNYRNTLILAVLSGTSVFMYNGLLYFALGTCLAFLLGILKVKTHLLKKTIHVAIYGTSVLMMAYWYYIVQMKVTESTSLTQLFHALSDTNYFGGFTHPENGYFNAMMANVFKAKYTIVEYLSVQQNAIYMPVNFSNHIGELDRFASNYATFILFGLGGSVFITLWRSLKNCLLPFLIIGSATYFTTIIGFTLRNAGSHYFVLVAVPSVILFLSVFLPPTKMRSEIWEFLSVRFKKALRALNLKYNIQERLSMILDKAPVYSGPLNLIDITKRVSLFLLVLLLLYYHGYSPIKLNRGTEIGSNPFYETHNLIKESTGNKKAVCFHEIDDQYYPNSGIKLYYNPKFNNISWHTLQREDEDRDKLIKLINEYRKEGHEIFMDQIRYGLLSRDSAVNATQVGDSLWAVH